MTDKHRAISIADLPFVLVPVELSEGRECWSLFHVPCDMFTGNDPGWWQSQDAEVDVQRWWFRLSLEQQSAFRGTDIQEMKDRDCVTALDELVELSDFRIVGPDEEKA